MVTSNKAVVSRFLKALAVLFVVLPLLSACAQTSSQGDTQNDASDTFERVVNGLNGPIDLVNAGDGSGRMFVVEQEGFVRILEDGSLKETPFIEITDRTRAGGERGLLGLAFHPNYETNGLFYVNFTDRQGDTVVAEYEVSNDPNVADPATERVLLTIAQPYGNHNGGDLAFGPDGYLYIATGDGGSGGDPENNGQSMTSLLGKLLRIDVSADGNGNGNGNPYTVPQDNPFVNNDAAADEIWAYGLRNPWRFSFDRATGDLFIGDVGQNAYEEISYQTAASPGGENYGWRVMEGFHCFAPKNDCDETGLVLPIAEYSHDLGNSVTGGYVYRGQNLSDLAGSYFYGDFGSGKIWRAVPEGDGWRSDLFLDTDFNISSFGEDEAGELYVVDYGGSIYRLTQQ